MKKDVKQLVNDFLKMVKIKVKFIIFATAFTQICTQYIIMW